ncbi:MAG: hypothetical protein Alpg2KO_21770 [Alphaproteobacteria bacterium]
MEGGYLVGVLIAVSLVLVPVMGFIAKSRGRSGLFYAIITFVWTLLWFAIAGNIVTGIAASDTLGINRYTLGVLLGPGVILIVPMLFLLLSGGRSQEPHLTEEEIQAEMERIRAENERYQNTEGDEDAAVDTAADEDAAADGERDEKPST